MVFPSVPLDTLKGWSPLQHGPIFGVSNLHSSGGFRRIKTLIVVAEKFPSSRLRLTHHQSVKGSTGIKCPAGWFMMVKMEHPNGL